MNQEKVLRDGTVVRCKSVPFLAVSLVVGQYPGCQMPAPPVEKIPGKAGITTAMARPGTPQYDEYQAECERVAELRQRIENEAPYFLGIVGWKAVGSSKFVKSAPKDWVFPSELSGFGVVSHEGALSSSGRGDMGRAWDYILFELLADNRDNLTVGRAIYGTDNELITDEEVEAIAEKFPGDEERTADS